MLRTSHLGFNRAEFFESRFVGGKVNLGLHGKVVHLSNIHTTSNEFQIGLNDSLKNGIYMVKISSDNEILIQKVILQ